MVVQHLWCRKICQIVCRVSRKWMESKFLDQDVDVVSLANKGIVIGCFVGRNYNKILMETRKLTDNIRVTKMDSDLVLTECFSRRILRFTTSPIDLIHSERVSSSTSSFLAPPPWGPGGLSRECAPPYPQRDRKRRLNGAVCRNHRIKRLVPCRC